MSNPENWHIRFQLYFSSYQKKSKNSFRSSISREIGRNVGLGRVFLSAWSLVLTVFDRRWQNTFYLEMVRTWKLGKRDNFYLCQVSIKYQLDIFLKSLFLHHFSSFWNFLKKIVTSYTPRKLLSSNSEKFS